MCFKIHFLKFIFNFWKVRKMHTEIQSDRERPPVKEPAFKPLSIVGDCWSSGYCKCEFLPVLSVLCLWSTHLLLCQHHTIFDYYRLLLSFEMNDCDVSGSIFLSQEFFDFGGLFVVLIQLKNVLILDENSSCWLVESTQNGNIYSKDEVSMRTLRDFPILDLNMCQKSVLIGHCIFSFP